MSNVLKKIIGLKAEQLDDLVNDRLVIDGETKTYDELNSLYVVNVNEETGEVDLSGFATEDWVKSAHQTIDSITSQDDGFDILYSTGAEMTLPIRAEDGIVVDVAESGDYIVVHLEDTFLNNINKAAKALVTPVTTPTEFELVGISTANSQQRVKLGEGLSYEAGELKVIGGGGTQLYAYIVLLERTDGRGGNAAIKFIANTLNLAEPINDDIEALWMYLMYPTDYGIVSFLGFELVDEYENILTGQLYTHSLNYLSFVCIIPSDSSTPETVIMNEITDDYLSSNYEIASVETKKL